MDQSQIMRFLGQAETYRVVLLMVVVVAFVSGFQYFELAPLSFISPGNVTVSEFIESNNTSKSAENETFLASQEASSGFKPYNNTTEVLKNFEHKFLNDSPKTETSGKSRGNETSSSLHSLQPKNPQIRKKYAHRSTKKPPLVVISITQMNNMTLKRHNDPKNSPAPRWGSKVDEELKTARDKIKNSALVKKDDTLYAPLYHNLSIFRRSYELMERTLKVYVVYSEGDRPIFHQPEAIMEGIYASEGWFMKLMESNHRFLTRDPTRAHLFYLSFSSRILQQKLYVRDSHSRTNLVRYLKNYIDLIASKYPFWNRTRGSDHFFTACHDWAPAETRGPYMNCIRSLCNADVGVDFVVGKDVSLPETKISSSQNPNGKIGGNRPSKRTILAFFAGNMHGYVRPILLNQWSSSPEPDMKIFNRIDHKSYIRYMKRSRFCVCAKGYEVNCWKRHRNRNRI